MRGASGEPGVIHTRSAAARNELGVHPVAGDRQHPSRRQ